MTSSNSKTIAAIVSVTLLCLAGAPASAVEALSCKTKIVTTGASMAISKSNAQRRAMRRAKRKWKREVKVRYGERFAKFSNAQNVVWDCNSGKDRNCRLVAEPCG